MVPIDQNTLGLIHGIGLDWGYRLELDIVIGIVLNTSYLEGVHTLICTRSRDENGSGQSKTHSTISK